MSDKPADAAAPPPKSKKLLLIVGVVVLLLALAAGLMHFRSASFASMKRSRSLALRITGLLPVFAAAATVCLVASAALLSDERSSACEFVGSADAVAVAISLPFRMALLGALVVIASPLSRKRGGIALLLGKIVLLWVAHGVSWVVLAAVLGQAG